MSFKVNIKSKNAKSIFLCQPAPSPNCLGRPKLKKVRKGKYPYSLTWSLLKTIHCFKLLPDVPFFKLLHFLATICHSFSQSWGFLLVLVKPSHHPMHPQWASELLGPLGAFVFCSVTRNLSTTTGNCCSDTQTKKNPQFPTDDMLFNKQLVYAKNIFLKEHWVFVISRNFFLAG